MTEAVTPASVEVRVLAEICRVAIATRVVDERLWMMSRQGRAGFVLTPRGHEIAQIASAASIRIGVDSVWPYYRDLGVAMAVGVSPYEVFLGALARGSDPHSGGRQLTAHFSSPERRLGSVSSEIAAHVPHAVGAAYAAKVRGEPSVAFCYFGEGATAEGVFHEAMNIAAVHALPVLFICENNGYAISVPEDREVGGSLTSRVAGYGVPASSVDGTEWGEVRAAAEQAVNHVRSGAGPAFLEARVPRITPHSSQDDDSYRSDAERAEAAEHDPIPRLLSAAVQFGIYTQESLTELERSLRSSIVAAEDRALGESEPEPQRARRWLHAGERPPPFAVPADLAWEALRP